MVYASLSHCAPCKRIFPEFQKLTDKYKNVAFCKIVIDDLEDDDCETYIQNKLKLTKYPSFTLLNNNIILDSVVGPYIDKITLILDCIGDDDGDDF
jgi:thiol-disulfide isomerase/thioredoxin